MKNYDKYIDSLLNKFESAEYLLSDDIPNIDLYMDQVTTFMDDNLGILKRTKEDKILTKTMINNYSKNQILPPPVKKKYTPDHMILLLFIYYFKHVLSITDIQQLLDPLIQSMLVDKKNLYSLSTFYDTVMKVQQDEFPIFKERIKKTIDVAKGTFTDINCKNKDILELFTIVHLLTTQATAQKYLAEKLIDEFFYKPEVNENKEIKVKKEIKEERK